jgi:hypothetical protein
MKMIYLNALITTPHEAGEEKIQKASNRDEHNIDYNSLGIRPPKGEIERDEDGNVILDDEDFETIPLPLSIPVKNLGSWVALLDGGTRVYTTSNVAYDVIEEVWDIDAYMEMISMSWWEKQKILFQSFFRRIKNKIRGVKEVDLNELLARPENQPDYKQE